MLLSGHYSLSSSVERTIGTCGRSTLVWTNRGMQRNNAQKSFHLRQARDRKIEQRMQLRSHVTDHILIALMMKYALTSVCIFLKPSPTSYKQMFRPYATPYIERLDPSADMICAHTCAQLAGWDSSGWHSIKCLIDIDIRRYKYPLTSCCVPNENIKGEAHIFVSMAYTR